MKIKELILVFNIISNASLVKVAEVDQFVLVRILIEMKPFTEKFESDKKLAETRFKLDNHESMQDIAQKYESDNASVPKAAVIETNNYFKSYFTKLNFFIEELLNAEANIDIKRISEETYHKLCASNNFTVMERAILFQNLVSEGK